MDVIFTQNQAARSLWEFGEDYLAEKTKELSDQHTRNLHKIVDTYWTLETSRLVGKPGKTLDLGTIIALTLVAHFEGRIRPLARRRRRPSSQLPNKYKYRMEEEFKQQSKLTALS